MAKRLYSRVSTASQSLTRQRHLFAEAGLTDKQGKPADSVHVYEDPATSSKIPALDRPAFRRVAEEAHPGDDLYVSELFRLCRDVADIQAVIKFCRSRGLALRVLSGPLSQFKNLAEDDATISLVVNVLVSVGQFQRDIQNELTREGVEAAEAQGRYRGRRPAVKNADDVRKDYQEEGLSIAALARKYGVSRGAVRTALEGLLPGQAPAVETAVDLEVTTGPEGEWPGQLAVPVEAPTGSANVREVSKVLKAAGYRPRNGESMSGRGGYNAHQDRQRVRVVHRFGPEGDAMTEQESAEARAELHDRYARVLAEGGYPLEAREPGAPVYVAGAKVKASDRPKERTAIVVMPGTLADHLTEDGTAPMEDGTATRKALTQAETVRRGKGYSLRVLAPMSVHREILELAWPLAGGEGSESTPAERKAYRAYADRIEEAATAF
ncbi:recombinase family protein [Streptomyces sp. NPDC126933]|uniref:recombinase family protein n=1 Tax=unclassified Streptomyces TaxID=2593676 RepID=UPI00364EBDF9